MGISNHDPLRTEYGAHVSSYYVEVGKGIEEKQYYLDLNAALFDPINAIWLVQTDHTAVGTAVTLNTEYIPSTQRLTYLINLYISSYYIRFPS